LTTSPPTKSSPKTLIPDSGISWYMFEDTKPPRFKHDLSFLATLAFAGGFFGARLFHLAFPSLMIITQGGIHFHHFWYGLLMIGVAGWLGIVDKDERLARIYAVVFGVGVGFVGDEVGLLLTFGDYFSPLTEDFFVAAVAFVILIALLFRYGEQIKKNLLRLNYRERLRYGGVFLILFSTIFFAFDADEFGGLLVAIGAAILLWGFVAREKAPQTD
jgi:hypothetical protein